MELNENFEAAGEWIAEHAEQVPNYVQELMRGASKDATTYLFNLHVTAELAANYMEEKELPNEVERYLRSLNSGLEVRNNRPYNFFLPGADPNDDMDATFINVPDFVGYSILFGDGLELQVSVSESGTFTQIAQIDYDENGQQVKSLISDENAAHVLDSLEELDAHYRRVWNAETDLLHGEDHEQ